ncbi:hypothetical protein V7O62_04675 [Methanolobus sp. ZRKC2]|uniref:hypothetical protein n=1 Tax=Methanolobus sp. ZRKC2 TaxID=3125783 RepID=UPI003254C5F2
MDDNIVIEKAIKRIAEAYCFDIGTVRNAIYESKDSLDLKKMVSEGIFCFRGPNNEIRYDNASICLSNKILANTDVAKVLLPEICARIRHWDKEDINVLFADMKKAISIMELNPDDFPGFDSCGLDINSLPSEKIPLDIEAKHRIWAMDKKNMCLVGIDANKIMHVDDIRKLPDQANIS